MKLTKRALSMALALVMALGLFAVGAGAAGPLTEAEQTKSVHHDETLAFGTSGFRLFQYSTSVGERVAFIQDPNEKWFGQIEASFMKTISDADAILDQSSRYNEDYIEALRAARTVAINARNLDINIEANMATINDVQMLLQSLIDNADGNLCALPPCADCGKTPCECPPHPCCSPDAPCAECAVTPPPPPTPPTPTIFGTGWAATWYNWILFFVGFGWIWMWIF